VAVKIMVEQVEVVLEEMEVVFRVDTMVNKGMITQEVVVEEQLIMVDTTKLEDEVVLELSLFDLQFKTHT
jgi:hypothetical protein